MTETLNYSFVLPNFDADPWHSDVNNNFTKIDALLAGFAALPNFGGIWQNSTSYLVGAVTIDSTSGLLYTCVVMHTSAASPTTFAADRAAHPTYWIQAANYDYVTLKSGRKNLILNGDMEINQSGVSGVLVTSGDGRRYVVDNFYALIENGSGTLALSQVADVPVSGTYCLQVSPQTTDASPSADDSYAVGVRVPGYSVAPLKDKLCTLSFYMRSSYVGTYTVSFRNRGDGTTSDRSYTVPVSVTTTGWEKKTITFVMDDFVLGTWDFEEKTGLIIEWCLAAGSTYALAAPYNQWVSDDLREAASQDNFMASASNTLKLCDVQLEPGLVATDFEIIQHEEELLKVLAYRELLHFPAADYYFASGIKASSTVAWGILPFVKKNIPPTVTLDAAAAYKVRAAGNEYTGVAVAADAITETSLRLKLTVGSTISDVAVLIATTLETQIILDSALE
jgi:hypothetical protein